MPVKNGRHFADNIFKYILFNMNCCIVPQISMTFAPAGVIISEYALASIIICCQTGDKPLSEPMMA